MLADNWLEYSSSIDLNEAFAEEYIWNQVKTNREYLKAYFNFDPILNAKTSKHRNVPLV